MTLTDAQEVIQSLAVNFSIPPCGVRFHGRAKNGVYHSRSKVIVMSWHPWRGAEACLLHEFAHHLVMLRSGHGGHGEPFKQALIETVKAYYGDTWQKAYPWHTEYRSLRGAGKVGPNGGSR